MLSFLLALPPTTTIIDFCLPARTVVLSFLLAHSWHLLPSVPSQRPVDSARPTRSITTSTTVHTVVLCCLLALLPTTTIIDFCLPACRYVLSCCPFCLLIRGASYQLSNPSVLSTQRVPLAPLPPARQYILLCCAVFLLSFPLPPSLTSASQHDGTSCRAVLSACSFAAPPTNYYHYFHLLLKSNSPTSSRKLSTGRISIPL